MSDTKERRLKITPGKAVHRQNDNGQDVFHWIDIDDEDGGRTACDFNNYPTAGGDATLYADAHNTAREVDMLPSEILAKLREAERLTARLAAKLDPGFWASDPVHQILQTLNLPKP